VDLVFKYNKRVQLSDSDAKAKGWANSGETPGKHGLAYIEID
jgi:hypothetical protein